MAGGSRLLSVMESFFSQISVAPPWLWGSFSVAIVILLFLDLAVFGRGDHVITPKRALLESGLWISIALIFNGWFASAYGITLGIEFLTGYLVEKSLSVDNLFVILLIFGSFKIPAKYQHRVLFYGVLGAIVLRALFIVIGAELLHRFHWILYVFGGILVLTAIKFLMEKEGDQAHVADSRTVRVLKKFIPTTSEYHGHDFFVRHQGKLVATPLFLALAMIEITDLIFAVDSIPAVFSVTEDAFVAFASNILAILGLRAL
jgi:tellurite resistance protein TerC